MTIKEYLESIGVLFETNEEALRFLNQAEVIDFLSAKKDNLPKEADETKSDETRNPIDENIIEEIFYVEEDIPLKSSDLLDDPLAEDTSKTDDMAKFSDYSVPMNEDEKQQARDNAFAETVRSKHFTLQNAKVNQPYNFSVDPDFIQANHIGEFWFDGLEALGLEFDKADNTIKGIPTKSGDHKITWHYRHIDWTEGRPTFQRDLTLVVNPDPRSLWNNTPTSTDIPFYKPDCDKAFRKVGAKSGFLGLRKEERKDMVAASQRGRSHAHGGSPRDDDFAFHFDEKNEWYVLVVADGAGSAKYSRRGSEIACHTTIDVCRKALEVSSDNLEQLIAGFKKEDSQENRKKVGDLIYQVLGAAVFKSYKNIEEEAKNSDSELRDFSTTLLMTICKKFKFGWFVASFWVGDGGIGIYDKNTQFLKVMGEPDGGEFAGQTRFLTMPEIIQPAEIYRRLRFGLVDDFTALVLMTDGITDPKFETDANLMRIEKWNSLWEDLSKEVDFENDVDCSNQLLAWLDFWSPGNHDDRTIAILY
ncbi:PP2C family serine/threonine-protein phosphatase [Dysgonomonas sp. 520]|uniref:PP2C family serine/threonine-protein phosphatase n=1 Tax=Dysgonomonas sp. 520 TaxID=2302931 RepID=UPI0013D2EFED|nr:PP2C family serine/threonine-protein phosphatase [Dysgonomonas sp. 520]NDW10512.1 protein phosphatase 2C domain-containing protein [Dysgonomonas sp. 520]